MKRFISGLAVVLMSVFAHAQTMPLYTPAAGSDLKPVVDSMGSGSAVISLAPGNYTASNTLNLNSGQSIVAPQGSATITWAGPAAGVMIRVRGSLGPLLTTISSTTDCDTAIFSGTQQDGLVLISRTVTDPNNTNNTQLRAEDNELMSGKLRRRPILYYPAGADLYRINPVSKVTLRNVAINAGNASQALDIEWATDFRMESCTVGGGDWGMNVANSFRTTIDRCRFEHQTGSTVSQGIHVESSTGGTISGNTIINEGVTGIVLNPGTWFYSLTNNEIYGTGTDTFPGNPPGRGGDGIHLVGAGATLITNNRILGANCYGIWLVAQNEDTVIANNVVVGGITAGVAVNNNASPSSRRTIMTGNVLLNNKGGAFGVYSANGAIVRENVIDRTPVTREEYWDASDPTVDYSAYLRFDFKIFP